MRRFRHRRSLTRQPLQRVMRVVRREEPLPILELVTLRPPASRPHDQHDPRKHGLSLVPASRHMDDDRDDSGEEWSVARRYETGTVVAIDPFSGLIITTRRTGHATPIEPRTKRLTPWMPWRHFAPITEDLQHMMARSCGLIRPIVGISLGVGCAALLWRPFLTPLSILGGLLIALLIMIQTGQYRALADTVQSAGGLPPITAVLYYLWASAMDIAVKTMRWFFPRARSATISPIQSRFSPHPAQNDTDNTPAERKDRHEPEQTER